MSRGGTRLTTRVRHEEMRAEDLDLVLVNVMVDLYIDNELSCICIIFTKYYIILYIHSKRKRHYLSVG